MHRFIRFFCVMLAVAGIAAPALASGFPDDVRTIHLIVSPDQALGQVLTVSTGDVVYSDSRTAVYRTIVTNDRIQNLCVDGVCHNVPRDNAYEQVPYGMSIYCTRGTFAEASNLFGKRAVHSCIRTKNSADLSNIEIFSIASFDSNLRIVPRPHNVGNYLRLADEKLDSIAGTQVEGWADFFTPVELRNLGVADGKIRFRVISRNDESVVRTVNFPYEGGNGRIPVSGVNTKAGDTDFPNARRGGTDEEVTGMVLAVSSADANSIAYAVEQVTFERQFAGSQISLAQGDTTISLRSGPAR
ncbi:hypothetical protein [Parvibaculum sp.]|uniref:hypothetical protein n=1 Tax=Parvibaculum sp. TaxID=2024848 RepID=UPI003919D845